MKVIGYIRVSTGRQATEGLSLEAQTQRIYDFAKSKNIATENVLIFQDAGVSGRAGSRGKRAGLDDALAAVEAGDFLVAYSLSRLARSTKHLLEISEFAQSKKAHLVTLSENIDTSTASGQLLFTILGGIAEFESKVVSERVKAVTAIKKERGEKLGGVAPYGFKTELNGAGKPVLVEDADEMAVIQIAVELRRCGFSLRKIATELNVRGFRTRKNNNHNQVGVMTMLARVAA
jgi:site-specific DNA recombinase